MRMFIGEWSIPWSFSLSLSPDWHSSGHSVFAKSISEILRITCNGVRKKDMVKWLRTAQFYILHL